jgi:hypothetical protein
MAVAELSIPHGWEEITAQWMTAALADHFPAVEVPVGRAPPQVG